MFTHSYFSDTYFSASYFTAEHVLRGGTFCIFGSPLIRKDWLPY